MRTVTRAQVMAACQALGLDPNEVAKLWMEADWIEIEGRPNTAQQFELIRVTE